MRILLSYNPCYGIWESPTDIQLCEQAMSQLGCIDIKSKYLLSVSRDSVQGYTRVGLARSSWSRFWRWSIEHIRWDTSSMFAGTQVDNLLNSMFSGETSAEIWILIEDIS